MIVLRACVIAALAVLAACATQQAGPDARVAFAGPSEQYVVVTVRNQSTLLPRAGSTPRDYDAPASYGASPAARREVRALAAAHGLVEVDGWPIAALGVHCVVFKLPNGDGAAETLRQLQRDRRVESVQPLNSFQTLSTKGDPYRGLQRNLDAMHVGAAHAWSRGENVRIAVVDTGVDAKHPDLTGRVVLQKNLVDAAPLAPERHGTAVAGVIAAIDNNREGIAGIAPAASVVGLKACWEQEGDANAAAVCNTFTLAKALVAAIDANSDVVNLSLGGPPDPLLQRLVDHGARRGVIYVGALSSGERGFPCNLASVICVGSAGQWSDGPQLFAPGQEVLTLIPGGRYDFVSGSSLAAASVSASVALLRARQPDLTAEMALKLLAPNAQPVANHLAPSIDVCDALAQLLRKDKCQ